MMRTLMTTREQNCYRERILKEVYTQMAWKKRYAADYPTCYNPQTRAASPRAALPPITKAPEKQKAPSPPLPASPPHPSPPPLQAEPKRIAGAPLMRPASPETRQILYQTSSPNGKARNLYLKRRGNMRPEEKYDFPLLSSWEYGWRLGDYRVGYNAPVKGRSCVVKDTFYSRNGVFNMPSATDTLLA